MKLEEMCVSLELSKKLKELGVKQDSYFYWTICNDCTKEYGSEEYSLQKGKEHGTNYAAFTASELLELLPYVNPPHRIDFGIEDKGLRDRGKYYAVSDAVDYPDDDYFHDDNFANCLAKMLIYLIENGIVKPESKE